MKIVLAILLGVLVLNVNANPYGKYARPLSYGAAKAPTFVPPPPPKASSYGSFVPQRPMAPAPRQEQSYGSFVAPKPMLPLPQAPRQEQSYGSFVAPKPMLPLPQPPKQVKQSYGSFVPQRPMLPIPPKFEEKIEVLPPVEEKVEQGYGQEQVEILPPAPKEILPLPQVPKQEQSYNGYSSIPTLPPRATPESGLCAGKVAGTKIAHQINNWQFYVCLEEGEIQLMECPMHLVYHQESEQCENTARSLPGCASNPCLNGGICSEFSNKKTFCQCQPGFSGEFCDKTDACDVNSCSGDGICFPQPAGSALDHICIWERGQKFGIEYTTAEINPCLTNNLGLKTFPSVLSKSVFIHCEGNIPHLKFCPLTSIYSHEAQRCEWETVILPQSFPTMEQSYGSGY